MSSELTGVHEDRAGSFRECYICLGSRKLHPHLGSVHLLGSHTVSVAKYV